MKLMLTSFGIEDTFPAARDVDSTLHRPHTRAATHESDSVFYRMPPVSFRLINESFMPDYELLLLCDQVVMDESSFHRLSERPAQPYFGVADTFKALKSEGRVELIDFSAILRSNTELLEKMLDHDIKMLDQWVVPLRESLNMWSDFTSRSMDIWRHEGEPQSDAAGNDRQVMEESLDPHAIPHSILMHEVSYLMHSARNQAGFVYHLVEEALQSAEKRRRKEYRGALREVLQAYLSYVNANLVLSSELEIGFHDWLDFTPFYSMKFLSVGKDKDTTRERRQQVEKLFSVAFPDLAITSTSALLKALNDKRIEELRALISDAALGKVQFDEHFANSVLTDVLGSERKSNRMRKVLGYLTLPIGFIPLIGTPAQKIIEEAVGTPLERKIKQKHQWFYMLSDIDDSQTVEHDERR